MSLAVPAVPTPYIHVAVKRRKTTWYSVRDGNWSDPLTWESNASRRWAYPGQNIPSPVFPQVGDDVYINHVVTNNLTIVVNNLFISGTLKATNSSQSLSVYGNLQSTGSIDFTGSNINLILYGWNNSLLSFTCGTNSTVTYAGYLDQNVMDLSYRNLSIINKGTKYAVSSLTILKNLTVSLGASYELSTFNLTVNGTTNNSGLISKTGSGSITYIGNYSQGDGGYTLNGTIYNSSNANYSGNPTVEYQGGFSLAGNSTSFNSGTGIISFTTNNQTISINKSNGAIIFINTLIVGAITVNLTGVFGRILQIDGYLDGTVSGSSFVNQGDLRFNTTVAPMATFGSFDKDTYANTVGYIMNGNFTIPYSTYSGLYISGSGTKTLSAATTLSGNLNVISSAMNLSTYDLSVSGTTTMNEFQFTKSSSGNILFVGLLNMSGTSGTVIDFTGNPNIELRNGFTFNLSFACVFSGSPVFKFTTNNQTINSASIGSTMPFTGLNILVSGAITVTATGPVFYISGTINGDNANSIFDNRLTGTGTTGLHYQNATAPMLTGKLYCNQAANTWLYDMAGNQDIQAPSDATPGYKNLTLAGSGAKKLLGNVSVKGTYTLTSPATLDLNGFSLTNP